MKTIFFVFKALVLALSFCSLFGGCENQQNVPTPTIIINGTVVDTTGRALPGFKFSIFGFNRVSIHGSAQIEDYYPIETDQFGRFSQKIVWNKSTDYYGPETTIYSPLNAYFKSCLIANTNNVCDIRRPNDFSKENTYTINIVVGQL